MVDIGQTLKIIYKLIRILFITSTNNKHFSNHIEGANSYNLSGDGMHIFLETYEGGFKVWMLIAPKLPHMLKVFGDYYLWHPKYIHSEYPFMLHNENLLCLWSVFWLLNILHIILHIYFSGKSY